MNVRTINLTGCGHTMSYLEKDMIEITDTQLLGVHICDFTGKSAGNLNGRKIERIPYEETGCVTFRIQIAIFKNEKPFPIMIVLHSKGKGMETNNLYLLAKRLSSEQKNTWPAIFEILQQAKKEAEKLPDANHSKALSRIGVLEKQLDKE